MMKEGRMIGLIVASFISLEFSGTSVLLKVRSGVVGGKEQVCCATLSYLYISPPLILLRPPPCKSDRHPSAFSAM